MPGKLFSSTELDADGRQLVLSDNISHVRYYDNSTEVWDKGGTAGPSWFKEVYSPNDAFDEININTSRWSLHGPTTHTLGHVNGSLSMGVEKDEGSVYVASTGKWKLSGDFDVRLYIDWSSYYNEYRSLTHTFFRVGTDASNSVRVSFTFNGIDGYQFSSEKTVSRNVRFFDWSSNGTPEVLDVFNDALGYTFFKITRTAGVLKTYISDGVVDLQIGDDVTEPIFSEDLYVYLGLESKEFNTYRHGFTKFYVVSGSIEPTTEFFSSVRGRRQDFPPRVVAVVDEYALSLIDEDQSKLWMRFMLGDPNLLPDRHIKVAACNGVIYCATSVGLIAFDFVQDKIFRYRGSEIQVADEFIALRNANPTFRTHMSATGVMPDNNIHDVACRLVGSEDYLALTHGTGITVRRALASGVSNSTDGPVPGAIVSISEKGGLFWAGYDQITNTGEVSFYSNVASLAATGTTSFSRSGFYGTSTALPTLGEVITSIDVRTVEGFDQLVVGSTEGISFISQNPVGSFTYGVESPAINPFSDPTFSQYIGDSWIPFNVGFIRRFNVLRNDEWSTGGTHSLLLGYSNMPIASHFVAGTSCGVYQDVDLTGIERIYFDINMVGGGTNVWEFQITVDGEVVKRYANGDGSFIKRTDSANVLGYDGIRRVELRIYMPEEETSATVFSGEYVRIDNIQTAVGNPRYRILPPGNASVKEVLLQHDSQGRKIYFATAEGFGAVDLVSHSLDYFTKLEELVVDPTTEVLSADFARVDDEA